VPAPSRFRLLRYTPMRDVLRGRLTGRLDVERILSESGLPAPLAERVHAVVRRTRLTRLEKVDIARELAAHFQDGLERGAPATDLSAAFGDSMQAARLIRRAKLRSRPLFWRICRHVSRAVGVLFIAVIALWVVLFVRLYSGSVKINRNTLAEFNAPALAIPEEQRAWPIYRRAALSTNRWPVIGEANETPRGRRWAEARAFVESSGEAVRLYRLAASTPDVGVIFSTRADAELENRWRTTPSPIELPPPSENPPAIGILLPQASVLREGARLLAIDAFIAAETGDAQRVVDDLAAMLSIARHERQMPFLITELCGIAILARTCKTLDTLLIDYPDLLSDVQLHDLAHRIGGLFGGGRVRIRLSVERPFFMDMLQRMYTDDGRGDGHLAPDFSLFMIESGGAGPQPHSGIQRVISSALMAPASVVVAGRREMQQKYDELMSMVEAEAEVPLWERDESAVDLELERMSNSLLEKSRYIMLVLLMPSLSNAARMGELATMERDATLAAVALTLHHRQNGGWPATLDELTPMLLPAVPLDRFDGRPLRYRLIDGWPTLYSVGADRDDDGGRPPAGTRGNALARRYIPHSQVSAPLPSEQTPDGDWVLWPPVFEPQIPSANEAEDAE
jgi:hypothetical protein